MLINTQKGGRQMDESRLFLVVCSDTTKSNGLKLEHWKFHTNMWKNIFTVRITEHQNGLPREVVETSSMEIYKCHLDAYLCNLLQGICFTRRFGLDEFFRFLPRPAILRLCDSVKYGLEICLKVGFRSVCTTDSLGGFKEVYLSPFPYL